MPTASSITLAVASIGTTVLYPRHTYVFSLVGYFDQPTNTATLPIISIYDSASTDLTGLTAKFVFQPTHEKSKETGGYFDIALGGILFTKGITVVVGSFAESTGSLYITHD